MTTVVQCDSASMGGMRPDFRASVAVADEIFDLDRLTLTVAEDYYTRFRRRSFVSDTVSAAKYLGDDFPKRTEQPLLCQEMSVPRHFLSSISLSVPRGAAGTQHAVSYIHAGRSGCMTPLHFDWDTTWVANVCLTGRKRFFIFPPSAGWLLSPMLNLSALCVPKFSEADRLDILGRLGGVEIVLNAGEVYSSPPCAGTAFFTKSRLSLSQSASSRRPAAGRSQCCRVRGFCSGSSGVFSARAMVLPPRPFC